MSTSYSLVTSNLFDPTHVPALDGPGVLHVILQLLQHYDSSAALVASNPYEDAAQKIKSVIVDSPLRREILQLLESRSARYAAGQR
ncbi:MAG TPA: hypothetical protein VHD36_12470 [Pirellulales bacterium]|nr:hypothetical protein [Pirellulales bacterium]